jgi:hypothetical protein
VTPESIEAFWQDDQHIGELSPSTRIRYAKRLLAENESQLDPAVEFGAGGSLGLIIEDSVASFRNVTVEPLK